MDGAFGGFVFDQAVGENCYGFASGKNADVLFERCEMNKVPVLPEGWHLPGYFFCGLGCGGMDGVTQLLQDWLNLLGLPGDILINSFNLAGGVILMCALYFPFVF